MSQKSSCLGRWISTTFLALLGIAVLWLLTDLGRWLGIIPGLGWESLNPRDRLSLLKELDLDIRTREDWKAKDASGETGRLGLPWRVTIHHRGGSAFIDEQEDASREALRAIQKDHQQHRGWVDIGYHFAVDRAGRIWEGRPLPLIGAHAGNEAANKGNVGVLALGNFDEQTLSERQRRALETLIERIQRRWKISAAKVYTHDEVRRSVGKSGTECPGKHLVEWVQGWRTVAGR